MSFFNRCKKYIAIAAISATVGVSYVYISDNKPNAYEVRMGDKVVVYIKQDKTSMDTVKALADEVEKKYGYSKLKNSITFKKAQVDINFLTDKESIRQVVLENLGVQVDALSMQIDGKEVALVQNENDGKEALDKVKAYYSSKSGITVKESKIKNTVAYVKKKADISEIDGIDTIAQRLEEVNLKAKSPIVIVELVGTTESKETISPAVTTKWSDDILIGQSKISSAGAEGQKSVVKEVVMDNNKVVSSKNISEKIITQPKEKVVLQGRKNPVIVGDVALLTPSRGAISSPFGMRWGKMHEGVDIAANIGEPIYAAMDGTVNYAGWENGYGNFIKIDHGGGLETAYGHCSKILVKIGQSVKKGDKIGEVGSTGNSTGPHVHFEVRVNGEATNPMAYLN